MAVRPSSSLAGGPLLAVRGFGAVLRRRHHLLRRLRDCQPTQRISQPTRGVVYAIGMDGIGPGRKPF